MSVANDLNTTSDMDLASSQNPVVFTPDEPFCPCSDETVSVCNSYGHDSDMCNNMKPYDDCAEQHGVEDCAIPDTPPIQEPDPLDSGTDDYSPLPPLDNCTCNDGTAYICDKAGDDSSLCTQAKQDDPCVLRGVNDCTLPDNSDDSTIHPSPDAPDSMDAGIPAPDTNGQDTDATLQDNWSAPPNDGGFDAGSGEAPPSYDDCTCCVSSDFDDGF